MSASSVKRTLDITFAQVRFCLDYQLSAPIQSHLDVLLSGRYQIIFGGRNRGMLPWLLSYGDFDGGCKFAVEDGRQDHVFPVELCLY